jgi:phosphocarrier protein
MIKEICVINRKGLHARPATVFAETASKHNGEVKVSFGSKTVNGKSLIALISLAVPRGGEVAVSLDGDEAETMIDDLTAVLGKNYD